MGRFDSMSDPQITTKQLPIMIGSMTHVMGTATISQTPDDVTITIEATGSHGQLLAEFVAAMDVVSLSFQGVPVVPRNASPTKENM